MSDKAFRIEFNVICFSKGSVSPQRIEDAILELMKEHEAFGYVRNMYVTRSNDDDDTEDHLSTDSR